LNAPPCRRQPAESARRPVRVAITHPYSWPEVRRGAERITVETGRALAARGHAVTLLTAGMTASTTREDGLTTVRFRRRFENAHRHERWFGWRITPVLLRGGFDAVHSLMPYDALAAIRTRRISKHVTVYDEMGNPYRWWWDMLPDKRVREIVVRKIDFYGCMSHFALDVLEEEWDRSGVIIPGGVRLAEFTPAAERAAQPTILFSGTLTEPRKRIDTLLEAVALLSRDVPDVRVCLSGQGDPADVLAAAPPEARERTELLGMGEVHEQGERYAKAWVTALPSESDSFGVATIESLASGTPIAVSDHGAPQEVVTPEVGAIARVRDPQSLADALGKCLELARLPKTAAHCRARAAAFDWDDAIAPLLEGFYEGKAP
jgi:glycosyltransferase involved in cell wall biosynthesis